MKKNVLWTSLVMLCLVGVARGAAELPAFSLAAEEGAVKKQYPSSVDTLNNVPAEEASAVPEAAAINPTECAGKVDSAGVSMPDGTRIFPDGTTILPKKKPLH